ncbi:MAG: four helix bundle protein [Lentisphaerae bacterium]|nr:four helix bundle protein [Lentisphaerota bacterium]
MGEARYLAVEDLEVYAKLCQLHIDVCDLSHQWPREERYELGSQVRRSSNSSPAQLAEKNDDRHIRNKSEGVNRSRGEAAESIHHLFMAFLKKYISEETFSDFRARYKQCIRMLNGLEKMLERKIPSQERRWHVSEESASYGSDPSLCPSGWPKPEDFSPTPETRHPSPPDSSS